MSLFKLLGFGFRVQDLGFRVQDLVLEGLAFRVEGLDGLWSKILDLGFII